MPWSPSGIGRNDLVLLVDEAGLGLTTTHWPLPLTSVIRAVDALPAALPPALDAARARLRLELGAQQSAALSVSLRGRNDALAGYGDDATPGSSATLRSPAWEHDFVAAQAAVRVDANGGTDGGSKLGLEGSALATEAFGVQLQAFSHRSWWGPGWQSSLVLSNNAPALDGIGIQRASASRSESPWLAWLGPWSFETFVARTDTGGEPAHPLFLAQRLTLRPFDGLEIGLTRTAQWGGHGRPHSLRSFGNVLVGRDVNADTPGEQATDPANEMAGYDLRWRCPAGASCAIYGQLIGEDEAGLLPSKFLGLYGIEFWSADGGWRQFVELAETGCRMPVGRSGDPGCAYRNHAYPDGYTNDGRWLGASVGPDSRLLSWGWLDAARAASLRLSYGTLGAQIGRFTPTDPATRGHLVGVSASRRWTWQSVSIVPQLDWTRVARGDDASNQVRVGVQFSVELGR
ncbi:MAG TPA: capsule assembly Wzi family protein [Burkholderiaceae bacterium]